MIVGVSGHQERARIDWRWVALEVRTALVGLNPDFALTSLAAGSDQLFAEIALELRISVRAVIPVSDYEAYFEPRNLHSYRRLLDQCERIEMRLNGPPERAFLAAGRYVVDHADVLVAVWDGQPSEGLGGTADVVKYARRKGGQIVWINPLSRTVE